VNWCDKHDHFKRTCPWCEIEELEAEIERLKQAGEWISVKNRLPERNTLVLITANGRTYTATLFDVDGIEYWAVNNRGNSDDPSTKVERVRATAITHWMPLPEPPEKEDSNEGQDHE
jgi:hypothetical protein